MYANECPICLEELEAGLKTPCGHQFCTHCIVGWQEKETNSPTTPPYTCPSCRSAIPYIELESCSSESDEATVSDTDESVTSRSNSSESFVIFQSRHMCEEKHKKCLACVSCTVFTIIFSLWIAGMTHNI